MDLYGLHRPGSTTGGFMEYILYIKYSPVDCTSKWTCTVCILQAPQVGSWSTLCSNFTSLLQAYSDMAEKKGSWSTYCTNSNRLLQGYSDIAEKKVFEAVSKLEADGLSVTSSQKFMEYILYGFHFPYIAGLQWHGWEEGVWGRFQAGGWGPLRDLLPKVSQPLRQVRLLLVHKLGNSTEL